MDKEVCSEKTYCGIEESVHLGLEFTGVVFFRNCVLT